jgi:hypothetical protein
MNDWGGEATLGFKFAYGHVVTNLRWLGSVMNTSYLGIEDNEESCLTKIKKAVSMFLFGKKKKFREEIFTDIWKSVQNDLKERFTEINIQLEVLRIVCKQYKCKFLFVGYNNSSHNREELEKEGYHLAGCVRDGTQQVWIKKKDKD